MIKVTTRNGETDLSIIGDLSDVCADTVSIVAAVRKSLAEHDPRIAELYEKAMKAKLIDLAFNAEEMMKEDKAEKAKRQDDEADKDTESEEIEDVLRGLASLLNDLLK